MSVREIKFPPDNGRGTIKAWAYRPLGKPKGVVQLIRGSGQYSELKNNEGESGRRGSICRFFL